MSCGHVDCTAARCRHVIPVLQEPRTRALIACQIQIQDGHTMTWCDRTYVVWRGGDGQWRLDLGEGAPERRRAWIDLVAWLCALRPRDVEILEAP